MYILIAAKKYYKLSNLIDETNLANKLHYSFGISMCTEGHVLN